MFWYFRRSIGIGLLLIAVLLVGLWIRSHTSADRLHGCIHGRKSFLIASKQGRVVFLCFKSHGHANWWKWETRSYPVDDMLSFPSGDPRQRDSFAGFGSIVRPTYFVMRPTYQMPDGTTVMMFGAATATLRGSGIIVPYWFLVLSSSLLGCIVSLRRAWRFSLRSLLIAVTLSATVFGLIATLDR
jgi:hypothetical protein